VKKTFKERTLTLKSTNFPLTEDIHSPINGKYVIILSNVGTLEEKSRLASIICQLNGIVQEKENFESEFTHVVTPCVSASKKVFAACASGKWLLKTSFLEESAKKNRFVDETMHVWKANEEYSKDSMIIEAAQKCRHHLETIRQTKGNSKVGMFTGFTVILIAEKKQYDAWNTILLAGGGVVINYDKSISFPENLEGITHAFFDPKKFRTLQLGHSVERLRKAKIPCCDLEFLRKYLLSGGSAPLEAFLLT